MKMLEQTKQYITSLLKDIKLNNKCPLATSISTGRYVHLWVGYQKIRNILWTINFIYRDEDYK